MTGRVTSCVRAIAAVALGAHRTSAAQSGSGRRSTSIRGTCRGAASASRWTLVPVGLTRQRLGHVTLVALEPIHRPLARRLVPVHVRHLAQPGFDLVVDVAAVDEVPTVVEALAGVADRPLHLALGLGRGRHERGL